MKNLHFTFFVIVVIAVGSATLASVSFTFGDSPGISRSELWRLGFGPAFMALAICLGVAGWRAQRGSSMALRFCAGWGPLFMSTMLALQWLHFGIGWRDVCTAVASAALWMMAFWPNGRSLSAVNAPPLS